MGLRNNCIVFKELPGSIGELTVAKATRSTASKTDIYLH
jgi:hypothetical protein